MKTAIFFLFFAIGTLCLQGCSSANQNPSLQKSRSAKRVLATASKMIKHDYIIRGSCWDYIDTLYTKAGVPRNKRVTIFKSNKQKGPYVTTDTIQPGDWLYFINTSYHNVEHSAVFIRWIDKSKKIGKCISYKGQRANKPARYKNYYLGRVYTIIRPPHKP